MLDRHSRRVLAHRVSITMEGDFCVAALEEEVARHGKPEIMNTDQGSQFSSLEFTDTLRRHDIAISMDDRGCWRDNRQPIHLTIRCRVFKGTEPPLPMRRTEFVLTRQQPLRVQLPND